VPSVVPTSVHFTASAVVDVKFCVGKEADVDVDVDVDASDDEEYVP
jgi:hypothetical protein